MNPKKIVTLSFAVVAAVSLLIFSEFFTLLWGFWGSEIDLGIGIQVPQVLAGVAALVLFFILNQNRSANEYCVNVVHELMKVTWADRKESLKSAVMVLIIVGIASILLMVYDSLWGYLTKKLLNL